MENNDYIYSVGDIISARKKQFICIATSEEDAVFVAYKQDKLKAKGVMKKEYSKMFALSQGVCNGYEKIQNEKVCNNCVYGVPKDKHNVKCRNEKSKCYGWSLVTGHSTCEAWEKIVTIKKSNNGKRKVEK